MTLNGRVNMKEKLFQLQEININHELYLQLMRKYTQLSYYDQYSIMQQLTDYLIQQLRQIQRINQLPILLNMQFLFDLMEYNSNIMLQLVFSIRLLKILSQNVEGYVLSRLSNCKNEHVKLFFYQYISLFYLNIIAVLKLYLPCLVLWHDLTIQVFSW